MLRAASGKNTSRKALRCGLIKAKLDTFVVGSGPDATEDAMEKQNASDSVLNIIHCERNGVV